MNDTHEATDFVILFHNGARAVLGRLLTTLLPLITAQSFHSLPLLGCAGGAGSTLAFYGAAQQEFLYI